MEKKVHTEMASDRISTLPEHVQQHILSFLKTKNAVRTNILSSSWRGVSEGLSTLDLGRSCFYTSLMTENVTVRDDEDEAARARRESIVRMREGLYGFLDRALGSKNELKELKLYVPGCGLELKSRLDGWLDGAVGRHVREVELEIGARGSPTYCLCKSAVCANSITKLKLKQCELGSSSLTEISLPVLRAFCLEDVKLDQVVMESLLTNCLNLESLSIKNCPGLSRLEIIGHSKLQKVNVEQYDNAIEAINIVAPNLLEFNYKFDGDSSGDTCVIEIGECKKMKYLEFDGCQLDDNDLDVILETLPALERLFLTNCDSLEYADILSQGLINLAIHNCRELRRIKTDTPNLKFFNYQGEDPITFVSKGALKLTDASVSLKPDFRGEEWCLRLIRFLAKLCRTESLTLEVASEKDVIIPEAVRTKSRPPLYAIKHLMLDFRLSRLKHPVEVIDSLLWLAPCPASITISNYDLSVRKSLKFMYKKPLRGKKKCGCWKTLPINCWRHSLNKILIESTGRAEDDTKLASFFEKGKIDGKIECSSKNTRREY